MQVMLLNSAWDPAELQRAAVSLVDAQEKIHACEVLPGITPASKWLRVQCGTGTGINAKSIKVASAGAQALHFCGIKVYGYQSQVRYQKHFEGGFAVAIDADDSTNVHIVNQRGQQFRKDGSHWIETRDLGQTLDIGVAPESKVWKANRKGVKSLNASEWLESGNSPVSRIAVGASEVWTVNSAHKISRYTENKDKEGNLQGKWETMPGEANDIGIGETGDVFIISNTETPWRGFSIQSFDRAAAAGKEWVDH